MRIVLGMGINTKQWLSKVNVGAKDIRRNEILFWRFIIIIYNYNNFIKSYQIHIGSNSFCTVSTPEGSIYFPQKLMISQHFLKNLQFDCQTSGVYTFHVAHHFNNRCCFAMVLHSNKLLCDPPPLLLRGLLCFTCIRFIKL